MGMYDWDKSLNFQVQTRQGADYQEELLGRALRREAKSESLQCIVFSLRENLWVLFFFKMRQNANKMYGQ